MAMPSATVLQSPAVLCHHLSVPPLSFYFIIFHLCLLYPSFCLFPFDFGVRGVESRKAGRNEEGNEATGI